MYYKVFTRKFRVFSSIIWGLLGIVVYLRMRAIIPIDFRSESTMYIVVSLLLASAMIFGYIYVFLDLYRKTIISRSGIIIKRPFKKYEFEWPEILEFRKHEKGPGLWPAGWRYCLSAKKYGEKHITIADKTFKDIDALITIIFRNAMNARFNKIENDTVLPFVKKYKMSKWELKDEYD